MTEENEKRVNYDDEQQQVAAPDQVSEELNSNDEHAWGPAPTEEEMSTLRKVSDKLSWSAWLVAIVELGERFTYYGISGPFQNYMQLERSDGKNRNGGLGLGKQPATALSYFFQFWCYVTPIFGGILADQYVGKYNAICICAGIYVIGNFILFMTSLPFALDAGAGMGGLATAMVIIGLGTGGIKTNVGPMIADQYTNTKAYTKVLKSGEKVIVDPNITIETIFLIFYVCINVGGLSNIATTFLEQEVDFWAAYLLPFCFFFLGIFALVMGRNVYIKRPPQGSVIPHTFKILYIGAKNKFKLDAAKPSVREQNGQSAVGWTDLFVDEVRRALYACRVFIFYPIFWVVYGQMVNNFVSQAGQMNLHGIPNDVMQSTNSLSVIVFIPIINRLVYPNLRKIGIKMRPITRITCGMFTCGLAMAYAAILQHYIYQTGPCYDQPLACPASDNGNIPNDIHVAIQTPAYCLVGLAEIFASVTGLEYAYTKAPARMKSFIMAMFLLTNAGGSALGIALSSVSVDPKVQWLFVGLSVSAVLAGIGFYAVFHSYNDVEEELNVIDSEYTQRLNEQLKIENEMKKHHGEIPDDKV